MDDGKRQSILREARKHETPPGFPAACALLVVDMQRFFLEEPSHAFLPYVAQGLALPVKPQHDSIEKNSKLRVFDGQLRVRPGIHVDTPLWIHRNSTYVAKRLRHGSPRGVFLRTGVCLAERYRLRVGLRIIEQQKKIAV